MTLGPGVLRREGAHQCHKRKTGSFTDLEGGQNLAPGCPRSLGTAPLKGKARAAPPPMSRRAHEVRALPGRPLPAARPDAGRPAHNPGGCACASPAGAGPMTARESGVSAGRRGAPELPAFQPRKSFPWRGCAPGSWALPRRLFRSEWRTPRPGPSSAPPNEPWQP